MKIAKKRKRGLSNIQIVVIALVIIIIVGILAYYLISSSRSTPTLTTTQQSTTSLTSPSTTNLKTYYIGVLLPLSGSLSSFGQAGEVVLSYGEQQVNQYLQQVNASFRIKLVIEDTQSNPTRALQDIQDLYSQGIKLVIGPSLSSEANAIKQFTDQHNMIVFADITSPFVPTTNGSIYTIIPTETDVGAVMANIIWTQGIRVVAVIWRGDSYGDGVFYSFNKSFTSLGGIVVPAVRYDPSASDFSNYVSILANTVSQLVNKYGQNKVGILAGSFDEVASIFEQASQYPVLKSVRWFGNDAIVLSQKVVQDSIAASFAVSVGGFLSPIFSPTRSSYYYSLLNYSSKVLGTPPVPDTYAMYDALWIYVYSILKVGSDDPNLIRSYLVKIAENFFGASGYWNFDSNQRRIFVNYEFWTVNKTSTGYQWMYVGYYTPMVGKIIYQDQPIVTPPQNYLVPMDPYAVQKLSKIT